MQYRVAYQSSDSSRVVCPCSDPDDQLHFPTSHRLLPQYQTTPDPDPEG